MALEMQFVLRMKSVTGAILSLILVSGLAATAEESACVKSFRKANGEYFKIHSQLESKQIATGVGGGLAVAMGAGCALARRNIVGAVGCGLIGVVGGGGAGLSYWGTSRRLQALYDAHRLYQAYYDFKHKESEGSEYIQQIMTDLGTQAQDKTMDALATLIEWGSLCDGEQPRSYEEALELIAGRLQAP